ncbi:leucyl aminopeptidase [Paenibacillus tarimensis]
MNTRITFGLNNVSNHACDAVVRFVRRKELEASNAAVWAHPQVDDALRSYYAKSIFKALPGDTQIIPTLGLAGASHAIFTGLEESPLSADQLRDAGAAAAKAVERLRAEDVEIKIPEDIVTGAAGCDARQAAQAITEGFLLALHRRLPHRRDTEHRHEVQAVSIIPEKDDLPDIVQIGEAWMAGIQRGIRFAQAVGYARDLKNRPGNSLTPEGLAEEAERLANRLDLECEVIDEWSAAEQGMGGLLSVGQGSANPPRMIILQYRGAPEQEEVWGLIGKGITFDTGGISLKKSEGMEKMISDMGGAAAVLGAMQLIGTLRPSVNVVAVIAAAENMPSDRAYKPGDVITTLSGRTIEIVNTDAEGRVVLADGLTVAIQRGATKLVDVATLTGAVSIALGDYMTAAVSNDEKLQHQVIQAGRQAGERIWPMPADTYYRHQLQSDAADLKNSGGRLAGVITGGLFIGTFAEEKPWVHLDISGTAWLFKDRGCEPKGATGVMVRTLAELLLEG